jgi:hypothetical protein
MARDKRDECRAWLAEGIDPRHRIGLITDVSERPVTVKDALDYWLEYYASLSAELGRSVNNGLPDTFMVAWGCTSNPV